MAEEHIDKTLKKLHRLKAAIEKENSSAELLKRFPAIHKDIQDLHNQLLIQHLEDSLRQCLQEKSKKRVKKQIDELINDFKKSPFS